MQSVTADRSTFIPTPGGLSARAVRWSRDGRHVVATLFNRFIDSLWKLDPHGGNPKQIQTLGWQVDSFAELDADSSCSTCSPGLSRDDWARSVASRRTFRLIYDANPQLRELELWRTTPCDVEEQGWRGSGRRGDLAAGSSCRSALSDDRQSLSGLGAGCADVRARRSRRANSTPHADSSCFG